jgi:hypothetical protein
LEVCRGREGLLKRAGVVLERLQGVSGDLRRYADCNACLADELHFTAQPACAMIAQTKRLASALEVRTAYPVLQIKPTPD